MDNINDCFGLAGRVCVVTGGGSGIGQGVAVALAGEGAKVALLDVNDAGNEETLALIARNNGTAMAQRCDVSKLDSIEAAHDAVSARFGAAQVLVNCAGVVRRGSMDTLSLKDWNDVLAINLSGYFLCSQVFGRAMLENKDGALSRGLVMSDFPSPYSGAYSVTKAGVACCRALAIEWGPRGVRGNCVAPSLVVTPMSQATYDLPDVMERRCATVPLGAIGRARPDQARYSRRQTMANAELRAKGRAMRRKLVGEAYADKLDAEVYTDPHMEKFAELTQEWLFGDMWNRPGIDLKTRSYATMISDVATGSTEALGLHVRFCRIHGWSEDEIVESMIHLVGYVGVPLVRKALIVARQVFVEMRAEVRP